MDKPPKYDVIIAGGGVAGLSLSIQLARAGFEVLVIEKHKYPFHKVCGEYVSNESRSFFERLGLDTSDLPQIDQLGISSQSGYMLEGDLDMGGFGLSRHQLDFRLSGVARASGVKILDNTKLTGVADNVVSTTAGKFKASCIAMAFGKSSPAFIDKERGQGANYIGVKYHIRHPFPSRRIELHNFSGGYCGISTIEENKRCLCYLVNKERLKAAGNSIPNLEKNVLMKNPHLAAIFSNAEFLFPEPVTISNISFNIRSTSYQGMLSIGDAAGCISPLTGNGMSMAAKSSVIAADVISRLLSGQISQQQMLREYDERWREEFRFRIWRGKQLQKIFGRPFASEMMLRALQPFKGLKQAIIRSTHGKEF